MGWRRAIRTLNAIAREQERQSRRRQRALESQQKDAAKQAALDRAAFMVEWYENTIERLTSLHRDCSDRLNWQQEAKAEPPAPPMPVTLRERQARTRLETYKPGIFARLFHQEAAQRAKLEAELAAAIATDAAQTAKFQRDHEAALQEHQDDVAFARRVLSGDVGAWAAAFAEHVSLGEFAELGCGLKITGLEAGWISAELKVQGETVIPREQCSLLASGKLSQKEMPKTRFYAIHQDYVCGAVLRVAREVLAVLPADGAIVTAKDVVLDSSTGHQNLVPILSVAIPRATLGQINFSTVDASDAMKNFVHRMDWKKTEGFRAVEEIAANSLTHA